MARKTFISYKFSEARILRDRIIHVLGNDATFYRGETSDSPDLTDYKTETIKQHLKDMIFNTSVTIVVISPCMIKSKWIDWEIEYSLRAYSRNGRTSQANGIVGVAMKVDGDYSWLRHTRERQDGHVSVYNDKDLLYPIINNNRFNEKAKCYCCPNCQTYDHLTGSYISIIEEDDFIKNPSKFIENAYEKSQRIQEYDICKTR